MKRIMAFTIIALLTLAVPPAYAATPNKAAFSAPLVWRGDGAGTYQLKDMLLDRVEAAKDGSVRTDSSEGKCEQSSSYETTGLVYSLTATWTFTGKVTMEVTATGNPKDYVPVVNGVPLESGSFVSGSKIKWRAALAPESALSEVKITYSDLSGTLGSFGNEYLSGFGRRREIYIKGSSAGELYHYQMEIKVGESKKALDCDINLNGASKSDFADIRFTAADGETSLPFYRESVSGLAGKRVGVFWVRIPQIPKTGLPIYMYYGKAKAADLSDAGKVFDFYDDFNDRTASDKKWKFEPEDKTGRADIAGSFLSLDSTRATTADYKFENGIMEYKAKASGNGAIVGIIKARALAASDLTAYSSTVPTAAHCVAIGSGIKTNDAKPIALDTVYNYRIIYIDGKMTFQRYADGWLGTPQADVSYGAAAEPANRQTGQPVNPIGLSPAVKGTGVMFHWIRTRKFADPSPQVDAERTSAGAEEAANLSEFYNVVTSPDGRLTLAEAKQDGYYISALIKSPFKARIITASWVNGLAGERVSGLTGIPANTLTGTQISVSTDGGATFVPGWQSGAAKYVSKKEFTKGGQLMWKAELKGEPVSQLAG